MYIVCTFVHYTTLHYTTHSHEQALKEIEKYMCVCVVLLCMGEKASHKLMKRVAANILEMEGYEVQVEKDIGNAVIDVYGEKDGYTVAVELGGLENERADHIQEKVNKFLHVPYRKFEDSDGALRAMSTEKERVNVYLNKEQWEELGDIVGHSTRSETIRTLIDLFIRLSD